MNTELPNSLIRISWTLPVFGVQQFLNLATRGQVSDSLNHVSDAARSQISGSLNQVAEACEKAQKTITDSLESISLPGSGTPKPDEIPVHPVTH